MKIDSDDKVQQSIIAPFSRPRPDSRAASFSDVLEQTVKSSGPPQVGGPPRALQPTLRPDLSHQQAAEAAYRSTTRVLDAMEQYQRLLGDRQATLRVVEPAVQRMRTELAELEPLTRGMAADHPLKQIAQEARELVSREIAAFDGGHYVQSD
jgi:hypothetical protein